MTYIALCAWCARPFEAYRSTARYCSASHRVTAWRKSKDAEIARLRAELAEVTK